MEARRLLGRDGNREPEAGLTLIETLAAVVIASAVVVTAGILWVQVGAFGQQAVTLSAPVTDLENPYWALEKLAQNALAVGTQSATGAFVTTVSGPVPVLALSVSSLAGIAPPGAPVTAAVQGGDWVDVAVLPVNGVDQLVLFAGGTPFQPPQSPAPGEVVPLGTGAVSYAGTTFAILPPAGTGGSLATPPGFTVHLVASALGAASHAPAPEATSPLPHDFTFVLGTFDY